MENASSDHFLKIVTENAILGELNTDQVIRYYRNCQDDLNIIGYNHSVFITLFRDATCHFHYYMIV